MITMNNILPQNIGMSCYREFQEPGVSRERGTWNVERGMKLPKSASRTLPRQAKRKADNRRQAAPPFFT
jgi:hypothetical protein